MWMDSWLQAAHRKLLLLGELDLGHPLGSNEVFSPQSLECVEETLASVGMRLDPQLTIFYSKCDGLSWPDVHVGYFIQPLRRLSESHGSSMPTAIRGPIAGKVLTFGSTGGGDLFAIRMSNKDVIFLPPGPVHDGIYDDIDSRVV